MALTRVFIVDDHAVLRDGLRRLLNGQPDLQVVGEAGRGADLLAQLAHLPVDVVLLDLCLPELSGEQVLQRLQQQHPKVQVLVLSSTADLAQVAALLNAGAQGFASKSVGRAELVQGIRMVAAGRRFLCTALGLAALRRTDDKQAVAAPAPVAGTSHPAFSGRELEVLQLVAEGLSNEAIANRLCRSRRTVETHRQNLMAKTHAKNTAALVKLAFTQGWLH